MNRRGFALVTTLWVIVVLATICAATLAEARLAAAAHRNRMTLRRAAWAREACIEMVLARGAGSLYDVPRVDLGRGTWCTARIEDPSAKLHLNRADPVALGVLIANDSLRDAVLDWRDPDELVRPSGAERGWYDAMGRRAPRNAAFADVAELRFVRGFDSAAFARVAPHLTTHGDGRINLNAAGPEVLATVPGFGPAALAHLVRLLREGGAPVSLEGLAARLGREDRTRLLAAYAEATSVVSVGPSQLLAHIEAGVTGEPARDQVTVTLVTVAERVAVIRRQPR